MSTNKKIISFRDDDNIQEYISKRASQIGVSKSDVLRLIVRERIASDQAEIRATYGR